MPHGVLDCRACGTQTFLAEMIAQKIKAARSAANKRFVRMLFHGFYGLMAFALRNRPISIRKRWMARVTGGTFIGLGAGVALSK